MAYYRLNKDQRMLIAANFGKEAVDLPLEYPVQRIALSNQNRAEVPLGTLTLQSSEVIVLECRPNAK